MNNYQHNLLALLSILFVFKTAIALALGSNPNMDGLSDVVVEPDPVSTQNLADYDSQISAPVHASQADFEAARHYVAKGDYEKAIGAITEFIKNNESYPDAYWLRASLYYNLGQHEKVEPDLVRFISLSTSVSDKARGYAMLGMLQSQQGRHVDGLENMLLAKELGAKHDELNFWLGFSYSEINRYNEAVERYLLVPVESKHYRDAIYRAAYIFHHAGEVEQALYHYRLLGNVHDWLYCESLFGRAQIYISRSDLDKAIKLYSVSLSLCDAERAYLGIAHAHYLAGRHEQTIEYLQKWNEGRPPSKGALSTISEFEFDDLMAHSEYREIIHHHLSGIYESTRTQGEGHHEQSDSRAAYRAGSLLGAYYYREGMLAEARAVFMLLADGEPTIHAAFYNLAEISAQMGLLNEAIKYLGIWISMVDTETALDHIELSYSDLKMIHDSPEFIHLLKDLRGERNGETHADGNTRR